MTSYDNTHLERQLSSLFRAEAQDAHLPSGTWQTISPKLGEPDAPSVLWQLRNAFSFPRWRNPMNVRYVAPTATVAVALLIALLFILLINDDADNAPVPAGTPTVPVGTATLVPTFTPLPATATAVATATSVPTVVPSATSGPTGEPTPTQDVPTPEPTRPPLPTAVPTATPVPPVEVPAFVEPDPASALSIPDEINPDLERQDGDVVVRTWTELFSNRHVRFDGTLLAAESGGNAQQGDIELGNLDLAFCDNGFGVILGTHINQDPLEAGEVFRWEIGHSPAGEWSSAFMPIEMLNPSIYSTFHFALNTFGRLPGDTKNYELSVENGELKSNLFDLAVYPFPDIDLVCSSLTF